MTDWRKMQGAMSDDSDSLPRVGATLMRWFMDGAITVLAHERIIGDGNRETRLGLARSSDVALLSVEHHARAQLSPKGAGAADPEIQPGFDSAPRRATRYSGCAGARW